MSQDKLETLLAIDPAFLEQIVRQDQRSSTYEILNWKVERLSDMGFANRDGIFVFSGQGQDEYGVKPWSVVLKTLKNPGIEQDERHLRYWKRELMAMQSGLLERLPKSISAPRCYGTSEPSGAGWIWMEHIVGNIKSHWMIDDYGFAARQLGRFTGEYLCGTPLPDFSWLCKRHVRTKLEDLPLDIAWNHPFVHQFFPDQLRKQVKQLWNERERFYNVQDRLPQVFSHFDFHRRNLVIRRLEAEDANQIIALDWAWCGQGALGSDLFPLIGGTAQLLDIDSENVPELETIAFEAYLAGLRSAGWAGDPDLVRLGYCIWFGMLLGIGTLGMSILLIGDDMAPYVEHQFGHSREQVASAWSTLCELAMIHADEARQLMARLAYA